jgi:TonB family protein
MTAEQNPQTPRQSRPGAMTMAMQAVAVRPSGPKVLRIGMIQGGKIVEERVLRKRETVTVGSSEKNHFVVHGEGVPGRFELFQLVGNDYILNFTDKMSGRVGLPGGVQDLDQMRRSGAARNAGAHSQIKLSENSRGKVVVGATSLLFQFVVPPPAQSRPQLPAAARAGLVRSIDWIFTAFLVFTFMTMFGFIVYLENADWPLEQGIASIPEELAQMIFEEPAPPPEVTEEQPTDENPTEEAPKEKAPKREPSEKPAEPAPDKEAEAKAQAEKTARIAEEAAQAAEALVVGALSSEAGGVLADVLADGAVTGNAQDILAQAAGIGVAQSASGGALRTRSGGGSSGTQGLGGLSRKGGAETTASRGEGAGPVERAVRGQATVGSGGDIGGSGDFDAAAVVAMIKTRIGAIRSCYERELKRNPTLAGKVTIQFTIEERGNVSGVKVSENSTGDDEVGQCVSRAIGAFRFNPGPEGGSVMFSYPFVFAPQN